VEHDITARMAEFGNDAERVDVLRKARRFKTSWVELAETLSRVLTNQRWKYWGYATFEDYCRKELHLRRETAYKLTGSYAFLKKRAPDALERDGAAEPLPPLDSVEFLRKASERAAEPSAEVPEESLRELERAVVEQGAPVATLRRKYKEVFFPTGDDEREVREKQQVLAAAKRLAQALAETKAVPRALAEDVEEQLGRLVQVLSAEAAA
jgi:hypothetical protein